MPAFQAHPDSWLLVVALAGGYLYALSAWGPRHAPGGRPASRSQRWCFLGGVAVMWVGADWPIHTLAEDYLYSAHMVQHLLFQLVAAPLLILGTPGWLARKLLSPQPVLVVWRIITRPLSALLIAGAWTALMHVPWVVNNASLNAPFHFTLHVLLVVFSVIMWWPVLSPLPEAPHASYPVRMVYLFGHSIIPTVPASFLTYSSSPLYEVYERAPRIAAWLDPLTDQQVAGLIMKIPGGLVLWAVIAVLWFRWQAEEESGAADMLYWRDLEGALPDQGSTPTAE